MLAYKDIYYNTMTYLLHRYCSLQGNVFSQSYFWDNNPVEPNAHTSYLFQHILNKTQLPFYHLTLKSWGPHMGGGKFTDTPTPPPPPPLHVFFLDYFFSTYNVYKLCEHFTKTICIVFIVNIGHISDLTN